MSKQTFQTTLGSSVSLEGVGVHSGHPVRLTLHPAEADAGISFLRIGSKNDTETQIPAVYSHVSATALCTVIGADKETGVSTIEHVMAALRALNIDNVIVEVDNFEVPIMDGSSAAFVDAIDQAGIVTLKTPRRFIKILKPVRITQGKGFAELLPQNEGFSLDVDIDFDHPSIGRQRKIVQLSADVFRTEISRARTFGFMRDVEQLWKLGFAMGSSLENSVAIGDEGIINPEGLRFENEFVCHKMLDAIGDLALSGLPLIGAYRSYCGGHKMNFSILKELFADPANYTITENQAIRREATIMGEKANGMPIAVFAPEKR